MEKILWSDFVYGMNNDGTARGETSPVQGQWSNSCIIDPITGLVAFPCFLETFSHLFRSLLETYGAIGLAIGDVDNLKTYVESTNLSHPFMFGHLAGNAFMSRLGRISLSTFKRMTFPWRCIATFGGDEIILACAGGTRSEFSSAVRLLSCELAEALPRSVSFAQGWFSIALDEQRCAVDALHMESLCISVIAQVDRALFATKSQRKEKHSSHQSPTVTNMAARYLKGEQWCLAVD